MGQKIGELKEGPQEVSFLREVAQLICWASPFLLRNIESDERSDVPLITEPIIMVEHFKFDALFFPPPHRSVSAAGVAPFFTV